MSAIPRLKRRPEFLKVAATRRKWVASGLIVQSRPRPDEETDIRQARVGFTVSRKVGMAVTRNRAKRRLRAAAEQVFPLHAAPGRDYVLIGRKATVDRPFPDLVEDMKTALRRLDAWREDWREDGEETG